MLYPEEFLKALDNQRNKTIYARVIALTFDERPLESVEGRVTSGSINLDGASAIRRSCQLSMITPEVNLSNYYWSLNNKIKLSIGVANEIDNNYPDIIWFEQGIFVITSFNASYSTNAYTLNISGKDKMCLLNGEIGGSLNSSVDFGAIEQEISPGVWKKIKLPVKNIIREMIHTYAEEPFHNIIINDLDEVGLTLQEYRYDKPMFLFREDGSNVYSQGFIDGNIKITWNGDEYTLNQLAKSDSKFVFESLMTDFINGPSPDVVSWGGKQYVIAKIDCGETAGYTEGELVYPSDLIANIGESITSVLDKIKNFLGEFEYFYNIDGQFIFQKKKSYVSTDWTPIQKDGEGQIYVKDLAATDKFSYIFANSVFFTSINNTPNLSNLKNDFCVWGSRKGAGGTNVPIHMRYAIDRKPIKYTTIEVSYDDLKDYNQKYGLNTEGQESQTYIASDKFGDSEDGYRCDWREVIYRMALDYNKYNHLDDFQNRIAQVNSDLYPDGQTHYEQYYVDLQGFWRQLYNPFEKEKSGDYYDSGDLQGWAKVVYESPETLLFWFDFMDTQGELEQFSVPAIGARPKVNNDNQVKAIYYRDIPNVIFQSDTAGVGEQTGYRYFNVPAALSLFSKSAQGKSAKEAIDTLLYNHSYCVESVSITSIPIFYIDTNTRIYINDQDSGIEGEYIVSKLSIQLAYNGTMNITATKAAQRLL